MGAGVKSNAMMRLVLLVASVYAVSAAENAAPSAVTDLTMENFIEVVTDSKKHVLVQFFAPFADGAKKVCSTSKEFAPTYEKIASHYADDESIVVAKLDSEAHAVFAKMYKVTSFPTLKIFPKKTSKPLLRKKPTSPSPHPHVRLPRSSLVMT